MATKTKEEKEAEKAAADKAAAEQNLPADNVEDAKGKKVELSDKETGFYDPVTGFKVVRDQRVALGKTVGDATREAIQSGRLLVIGK